MPDYKQIAGQYIRDSFLPVDRISILLLHRDADGEVDAREQRIMSAAAAGSDNFLRYLAHMNATNYDVYVGANPLKPGADGRTKADVLEVRRVFLDVDKDATAVLAKIQEHPAMEPPAYKIESSPGKYQVIWNVKDFNPAQAETLLRNMTREFGADIARVDVSSVLRLPGFRNCKYRTPHYVTVERLNESILAPERFPSEFFDVDRPQIPLERAYAPGSSGNGNSGVDQSREDARFALRNLRRGMPDDEVARRIDEYRLVVGGKRKGPNYGRDTVAFARRVMSQDHKPERVM